MHPTCTEGEQADSGVRVLKIKDSFDGSYDILALKNKTNKTIELFEQIKRHSESD